MIPAARIHGGGGASVLASARALERWRRASAAGRVITWSATLGAAQAVALAALAHPARGGAATGAASVAAIGGLALVLGVLAALVCGAVWLARLVWPGAGRGLAALVGAAFYGAAALLAPAGGGVLAAALVPAAVAWALWLPAGGFAIASARR